MMATILKFALSVVLAVAGSMAGQRWITYVAPRAPEILDNGYRDWEQHVIFDRMLIPFAVLGLLFTLLSGGLLNHILAAAAGGIVFLLLSILTKGGIGGGDIKLVAALGLWFGTEAPTHIAMTGLVLAGLVALVLLLTRQKGRLDYMAYGPYFALAAILTIIF